MSNLTISVNLQTDLCGVCSIWKLINPTLQIYAYNIIICITVQQNILRALLAYFSFETGDTMYYTCIADLIGLSANPIGTIWIHWETLQFEFSHSSKGSKGFFWELLYYFVYILNIIMIFFEPFCQECTNVERKVVWNHGIECVLYDFECWTISKIKNVLLCIARQISRERISRHFANF